MELTLTIDNEARIDTIIDDLHAGQGSRPHNHLDKITGYWRHHLSKISIEKINASRIRVSGESGFYFPGMTYSGLDLVNTLFKRLGQMRRIGGSRYDLSIPQHHSQKFGYHILGKWLSFDFLRSIHHAQHIITHAERAGVMLPEQLRVLEIGSGTGIQALVFKLLYKKSVYYMVDFSETLSLAAVFLSIVLPESKILFYNEWKQNPELLTSNEYDFVLIPNHAVADFPSDSIDLAINTVSMQEMNYATINNYFKELRRILTGPSLFYQCNRDKMMDGVMIELSQYPYIQNDVHLYKERDAFFRSSIIIRKCFGRFSILRYIRIPLLKRGIQYSYLTVLSKK